MRIQIKKERIEVVKTWPQRLSIKNIQVFVDFANFYYYFIKGFNKIAAPLTLMLKIMIPLALARPGYTMVYENEPNTEDGGGVGGGKSDDRIHANLSNSTKVKKNSETSFLTSKASLAFT